MSGFFITFEGIEGSGKSTQLGLLASTLIEQGHFVVETREPGGTAIGNILRSLLLDHDTPISLTTELLLMLADRAQHIHEIIAPALAKGAIVLCDRYADSTMAYQGYARNIPRTTIAWLNAYACDGIKSNLTFVLDLPVQIGLARARARGGNKFETEMPAFHEIIRHAYQEISLSEPYRVALIDANNTVEAVQREVLRIVKEKMGLK